MRPVKWSFRLIYRFCEIDVVDAAVDDIGVLTSYASALLRRAQTGYVRNYALLMLFGAFLLVGYYVVGGR